MSRGSSPGGSSAGGPAAEGERRLRAVVRGRVQGVGFRATTAEQAQALGLAGWVRNLPDGGVELEAQGSADAVARLLAYLQRGPRLARVDGVDLEELPAAGAMLPRPFQVRRDRP